MLCVLIKMLQVIFVLTYAVTLKPLNSECRLSVNITSHPCGKLLLKVHSLFSVNNGFNSCLSLYFTPRVKFPFQTHLNFERGKYCIHQCKIKYILWDMSSSLFKIVWGYLFKSWRTKLSLIYFTFFHFFYTSGWFTVTRKRSGIFPN